MSENGADVTDGRVRRSDVLWDEARLSQHTASIWYEIFVRDHDAWRIDDSLFDDVMQAQVASQKAYKRASERYDLYLQTLRNEER